jgi:hypothetical protein
MTVSIFGVLITVIGCILLFRASLTGMIAFVLICSLLGGAEAFGLGFLGGASVQPESLALVFLVLRAVVELVKAGPRLKPALEMNSAFIFFCLYSAVTAFILPKIFAGAIAVSPMRTIKLESYFDTFPLKLSSQNFTAAFYILGTMMSAIVATLAAPKAKSGEIIVRTSILVAWIHIGFGVLGVILTKVGADYLLDVFRNASYAQLDQSYEGLVRIDGIFPETSDYTAYAFVWLVFMTELWLRNVWVRSTGLCAAGLAAILIASTSASAYFSVSVYAAVLFLRSVTFPGSILPKKIVALGALGMGLLSLALLAAAAFPHFVTLIGDMLNHMTVEKMDSISGRQRAFWAMQGVNAFKATHGIGVGSGSFRSSSIATAILGSTGVVGAVSFAAYYASVLKPWRASTFVQTGSPELALGVAASWTACLGLLPAFIASPTPDPGALFGLFGGLALGWRALAMRNRAIDRRRAAVAVPAEPSVGQVSV